MHLALADLAVEEPSSGAADRCAASVEVAIRRIAVAEVQPHRRQPELDGQPVAVDALQPAENALDDRCGVTAAWLVLVRLRAHRIAIWHARRSSGSR